MSKNTAATGDAQAPARKKRTVKARVLTILASVGEGNKIVVHHTAFKDTGLLDAYRSLVDQGVNPQIIQVSK